MLLKAPPTKILPSACTAIDWTILFAFGSNGVERAVVHSSRAMRLRVAPPMVVKSPPTKILPSACTAIDRTSDVRVGVEGGVERAVGVQSRDFVAGHA